MHASMSSKEIPVSATKATDQTSAFRTHLLRRVEPFVGIVLVLVIWTLVATSGWIPPKLIPRPDQVFVVFWQELVHGNLAVDIATSLGRVALGVAIGSSLAIPIGILLAWYPAANRMFTPIINFFRSIPPIAMTPLVIVYLGIGEVARVSVLTYAAFFTSVIVIFEGVSAIEEIYVRAARVLGATEREIFRRIIIPLVIPQVFVALRISIGLSWATLVAAELLAATNGLGAVIQNAGNFFDIPKIFVGILCIGGMSLLMDYAVRLAMNFSIRWQERVER